MSVIDAEIEVEVPLRTVYDQWTQFEDFPEFMQGVEEVRQLDDTHLHWAARIAGVRREWGARITEQIPDQMVAWTSTDGVRNDGLVTFDAVGAHRTRITLRLDLEADGPVEAVGGALGIVEARARGDLHRFKHFIESRRTPTGAWRGEVVRGEVDQRSVTDGNGLGGERAVDLGDLAASTGGSVDLERILGTIPVVLVFIDTFASPATAEALESLGANLADFGRERVQVLAVARVGAGDAGAAADGIHGNIRVLADPDGRLAQRFGVRYRPYGLVTVLVGADGRHDATWLDDAGPDLALQLRRRLEDHHELGHQRAR